MNNLIDDRYREIIKEIENKRCIVSINETVCFLSDDLRLDASCNILRFDLHVYPKFDKGKPEDIIHSMVGFDCKIENIDDQNDKIKKFYNLYREFASRYNSRVV